MPDLQQLTHRVDQLEAAVRALYNEVQRLRTDASVTAPRPVAGATSEHMPSPPTIPPAPTGVRVAPSSQPGPAAGPHVGAASAASAASAATASKGSASPEPDLESMVGRYGALALATITILMAVGAFVQWAVARGWFGPAARVILGFVAAVIVAGVGLWLRDRDSRPFAHTLLALALAIVHVDAWGAGPVLHLIPSPVALAGAALASAALARLALVDDEPSIFSVGVGGALVAPFVTASGEPHIFALLAFGYIIIGLTVWAVRDRGWDIPMAVLGLGVALYAGAAAAARAADWAEPMVLAPTAFSLACALTMILTLPPRHRATLTQSALAVTWMTLVRLTTVGGSPAAHVIASAVVGTVIAYATIPELDDASLRVALGVVILPLAFLVISASALPASGMDRAALVATWALGAAATAIAFGTDRLRSTRSVGPAERAASILAWLATVAYGAVAIVLALGSRDPRMAIVALAAYATLVALIAIRHECSEVLAAGAIALGVAVLWSWTLLIQRPGYVDPPFVTPTSMAAGVAAACCVLVTEVFARAPWVARAQSSAPPQSVSLARFLAGGVVFWWVRLELAHTLSRDLSTFLLIAYYAVTGVGAVFIGRARAVPSLRHAGLAVAVYGALKAVGEASQLGIGLRIGSYLAAGIFLLAVAYWYRGRSQQP